MPRKSDKRIRLIEAAQLLIHQQGFNVTTLADIAARADVPLGNVFYYFKTKEAIGEAVIKQLSDEMAKYLAKLEENSDPKVRLMSLLQIPTKELELIASYGCSVGGLCHELSKQGGSLADQAAKLLHDLVNWCETQFNSLRLGAKSRELALSMVANIQGGYLLSYTCKDPTLAIIQSRSIQEWLEKAIIGGSKSGWTSKTIALERA